MGRMPDSEAEQIGLFAGNSRILVGTRLGAEDQLGIVGAVGREAEFAVIVGAAAEDFLIVFIGDGQAAA